jgi:hypothetical protein
MTKLEELKAAAMAKLDAAYVARGAACDADYAAAAVAAYKAELKKPKEIVDD